MRIHLPSASFIGYFSRRSPCASSRVAAPLAQCVPILIGLSNTGSCPIHTPFCTSAQMAQPTEQNGQMVFRRLVSADGAGDCSACALTRRPVELMAMPASPPTAVIPDARRKRRRERPASERSELSENASDDAP
jgi:hypothetical protein